jgi:hypothetical protein
MVVLDIKPGETRETIDPHVQVTLPGGSYRFVVVVEDARGQRSDPVELRVRVQGAAPP